MSDNDQSRTPLPPEMVAELKEIMEGYKEKFGDSILIQVGNLTEEHVGWGVQFDSATKLTITSIEPGNDGNIRVGLIRGEHREIFPEFHPGQFVTISPKADA